MTTRILNFMKTLRFTLLVAIVLTFVLITNHRSTAQLTNLTKHETSLDKYSQLILSLSERGDTNTATQITDLISSMHREQGATEAMICVRVLSDLKSGKTNEAYRLLETQLDGALMRFEIP